MKKYTGSVLAGVLSAVLLLSSVPARLLYADETDPAQVAVLTVTPEVETEETEAPAATETPEQPVEEPAEPVKRVTVRDVNGDERQFAVTLTGYESGRNVRAAVWSETNGQDDLIWYDMRESGGVYTVTFSASSHRGNGRYFADLWDMTASAYVGGETFKVSEVSPAQVSVENPDGDAGTCRITVKGASCPSGVARVQIPTWCAADQNDILWYDAVYDEENDLWYADISIRNHKYHRGNYISHVYATNGNGSQNFVGGATFSLVREKEPVLTVSANDSEGRVTIVLPAELAEGYSRVRAAVWTSVNSQDDLTWNTMAAGADGDYRVTVSYDTLLHEGEVIVHVYGWTPAGVSAFIIAGTSEIAFPGSPEEPAAMTAEADNVKGTFRLTVDNAYARKGIRTLDIAVWSKAGGQDDLIWYTAVQSGASYVVEGSFADHGYGEGLYYCHAYLTDKTGRESFCCAAEMTFTDESPEVAGLIDLGTEGSLETNYQAVIPVKLTPDAASIRAAVWSQASGQDDLHWYDGIKSGNLWKMNFSVTNQLNKDDEPDPGLYYVHVYYQTNTGASRFVKAFTFEVHDIGDGILTADPDEDGGIALTVKDVDAPAGVHRVRAAVWSEKNGQDDIEWQDMVDDGTGVWTGYINAAKHNYDIGEFHVHIYMQLGNGIYGFFNGADVSTRIRENSWHLDGSQEDIVRGLWLYNPSASSVTFRIYSLTDGEESAREYTGSSSGTGFFSTKISMVDHKTAGDYCLLAFADGQEVVNTVFTWTAPPLTPVMQMAKDRLDIIGWDLRAAYRWCVNMTYSRDAGYNYQVPAGRIHSEYFAEYGFVTHNGRYQGNCYVMAACFTYMARLLGYDAYFVEGWIGDRYLHSWCEIVINGTTYVFDPNFENENPGRNGYQITYGQSGTWKYTNWTRVD